MNVENAHPFVSIITVCYNAGNSLYQTVASVYNQSLKNWELIIKDGNSIDGSIDNIRIVDQRIRIIREKDTGIYNAMNRALREAKGDLILFLNAGDLLASKTVLEEVVNFQKTINADIYYGNYINARGDCCVMPKRITMGFLYRSFLCHQAVFYKKGATLNFDERFKLLADHNLNILMLLNGSKFQVMPIIVCVYEGGGISENPKYRTTHMNELKRIHKMYYAKQERYMNNFKYYMTVPHIRAFLYGNQSPRWMRKFYRKIVTLLRK